MSRRKGRLHRWMAIALTVALLAGQSSVSVLAQEDSVPMENEISDEEIAGTDDTGVDGGTDSNGEEKDSTDNSGDDNGSGSNDEEDADMANGDANAGEEAEVPAEISGGGVETVSGNGDGLEEPGSDVLSEENDLNLYADEGLNEEFDFVVNNIRYRITGDHEVTVARQDYYLSGEVTIPDYVENDSTTYQVKTIGFQAFCNCSGLTGIKISNGVMNIEEEVFANCEKLERVEIPDSVTNIGQGAFAWCSSLESIEIPDGITEIEDAVFVSCSGLKSVKIPSSVTSIGWCAFDACTSLSSIKTLEGVTEIDDYAFRNCSSLGSIRISNGIDLTKSLIFQGCSKLSSLEIIVPSNKPDTVPQVKHWHTFYGLPGDRSITFVAEEGTELTGEAFEKARDAFLKAGENDDNPSDNLWWGWKIKDPSTAEDTYRVTIAVRKDNDEWTGHNRTFALTKDNGATFVKNLDAVEAGTYSIYDVTGLVEDAYRTGGVDTGVTVDDSNKAATVDYYTVTFCDDDGTPYADTTEQKQQIILKTVGRVSRPQEDPKKAGYTFDKWVSEDKNTEFSFAATVITAPTNIYAKWTKNTEPTYKVTIRVKKDGKDWVNHNHTFALREDGGAKFITDLTQVPNGTYSIYDMTGINPDSYWSKAVDTGRDVTVDGVDTTVDVTVENDNIEAEINYYTVTFYDGAAAYQSGTPQEPQVVLRGYFAKEPERPQKTGYRFEEWKTEDGGSTAFDFNKAVNDTTGVYASWKEDPTPGPDEEKRPEKKPDDHTPGDGENSDSGNEAGGRDTQTVAIVQTTAPGNVNSMTSPTPDNAASEKEPRTGDVSPVEIYATVAMIAGLTYLLLYFMEERRGMTEREKEVFVAAFIRWAKKGGTFRRCCAMAAIFCLLVYYHSIGKRVSGSALRRECLEQAM